MSERARLRQALEDALAHDPDDRAAHSAYADLLQDEGDPRGEFIRVQLALEDEALPAAERRKLRRREQALWKKHRLAWIGAMGPYLDDEHLVVAFERGWLADVTITQLGVAGARLLAQAPEARLLRRLQVKEADEDALAGLLEAPWLANLRLLHLGRDRFDPCAINAGPIVELVARMPRLEELYLLAHDVEGERLFALPMPNLRVLWVYHQEHYPLHVLADNPSLARLERLELHPHALRDERPYLGLDQLRALARSPNLPALKHLEFALSDIGDEGCAEIVSSGLLARLKVLDLCLGTVTDAGARILAGCPDFAGLDFLDVSSNALTDEGIALLEATGVKVESSFQHSVEENTAEDAEWLGEGDWE